MLAKLNNNSQNDCWLNNNMLNKIFWAIYTGLLIFRAVTDPRNSGIPAKSREIPPKNVKNREIRKKYFQIHVGKTYLILILAIISVLFTPNVQIYLETSSMQRVNNVPKLPADFSANFPWKSREILLFFPQNIRSPVYIVHIMLIEIIKESIYTITFC